MRTSTELASYFEALDRERRRADMFAFQWAQRGTLIDKLQRRIHSARRIAKRRHHVIRELQAEIVRLRGALQAASETPPTLPPPTGHEPR